MCVNIYIWRPNLVFLVRTRYCYSYRRADRSCNVIDLYTIDGEYDAVGAYKINSALLPGQRIVGGIVRTTNSRKITDVLEHGANVFPISLIPIIVTTNATLLRVHSVPIIGINKQRGDRGTFSRSRCTVFEFEISRNDANRRRVVP